MKFSQILSSAITLTGLFSLASAFSIAGNENVVVYWGQNSAGSQESLATYCESDAVDLVVLSFLTTFPGSNNLPEMNIVGCYSTFPGTNLLHCPDIASQIKTCQSLGKKVILSLGGAVGEYGFTSNEEANEFAGTLWNMFLGGTSTQRPFDDAILDGIDLDIENRNPTGYASMVTTLRSTYFPLDTSRTYYVAAAPQCVYPDASVGDAMANSYIDFAFVQFYNNPCSVSGSFNWDTWVQYAASSPNPNIKIYLGLPGATSAAGSGYLSFSEMEAAIALIQNDANFGGVMFWDASQAFANKNSAGVNYAVAAKNAMALGGVVTKSSIVATIFSTSSPVWWVPESATSVETSSVSPSTIYSTKTYDDGFWHGGSINTPKISLLTAVNSQVSSVKFVSVPTALTSSTVITTITSVIATRTSNIFSTITTNLVQTAVQTAVITSSSGAEPSSSITATSFIAPIDFSSVIEASSVAPAAASSAIESSSIAAAAASSAFDTSSAAISFSNALSESASATKTTSNIVSSKITEAFSIVLAGSSQAVVASSTAKLASSNTAIASSNAAIVSSEILVSSNAVTASSNAISASSSIGIENFNVIKPSTTIKSVSVETAKLTTKTAFTNPEVTAVETAKLTTKIASTNPEVTAVETAKLTTKTASTNPEVTAVEPADAIISDKYIAYVTEEYTATITTYQPGATGFITKIIANIESEAGITLAKSSAAAATAVTTYTLSGVLPTVTLSSNSTPDQCSGIAGTELAECLNSFYTNNKADTYSASSTPAIATTTVSNAVKNYNSAVESSKSPTPSATTSVASFSSTVGTCVDGNVGCSPEGDFIICNFGTWVHFVCPAGTSCYAFNDESTDNAVVACDFIRSKRGLHSHNVLGKTGDDVIKEILLI